MTRHNASNDNKAWCGNNARVITALIRPTKNCCQLRAIPPIEFSFVEKSVEKAGMKRRLTANNVHITAWSENSHSVTINKKIEGRSNARLKLSKIFQRLIKVRGVSCLEWVDLKICGTIQSMICQSPRIHRCWRLDQAK